jgi:hypothetical protein
MSSSIVLGFSPGLPLDLFSDVIPDPIRDPVFYSTFLLTLLATRFSLLSKLLSLINLPTKFVRNSSQFRQIFSNSSEIRLKFVNFVSKSLFLSVENA